jgi:hypothetical protein
MSDEDDTAIESGDVDTDLVDDSGSGSSDGEQGKNTVEYWKKRARQHEERARRTKAWADVARDAGVSSPDEIREFLASRKGDSEESGKQPDEKALRDQLRAELAREGVREKALDRLEAKAAKLFADPEDARALLAARVEDFVDDGKVDVDAINEALTDLLSKKPHLAAAKAARFQGGADGGARKGSQIAQLTEQDLSRMTPQQIEKARLSGQLNDLLGVS